MTDGEADAKTRVIRLFPGYAGTVLWAWSGTVDYGESCLTDDLISALQDWESLGEREGLTGIQMAQEAAAAWSREGLRLAHEVAAQLGSGFTIEVPRDQSAEVINSKEPPTNPEAAAEFESRRVAAVAKRELWDQRFAEMNPAERGTFRYEPLKGRDLDG